MERVFVVNCWSGKGKGMAYKKIIEDWYEKRGQKATVLTTAATGPNTAFNLGKWAVQEGLEKVGLAGGDGTYQGFVNGMMANNVPLRQLPALGLIQSGTGNNFAKNVGTPQNLIEALSVIENGHATEMDFGKLILRNEEKYFLNVVSFGFDALVTERAKKLKEKHSFIPRSLTYGLAALREISRGLPFYRMKLQGLGFEFDTELSLAAVLNGPTYGAIFRIAPGADLFDGLFNVCLIDKLNNDLPGKKRGVEILFRATRGKHVGEPEVSSYRTPFLKVSSSEPLPYEIDGEVLPAEKEYRIEVIPAGLKVLVPLVLLGAQSPLFVKAPQPQFA